MNHKPKIAVTMGDAAGVGPEICLDLLGHETLGDRCALTVYGSIEVLSACTDRLGKGPFDESKVLDLGGITLDDFKPGTVNAATGRAAHAYIVAAIEATLKNEVDAVVTAPINKEALRSAGIQHPGHTEIFAERTKADRWCMMMTSDVLTCSFVTAHVGYAEVPALLSVMRIYEVIELTREAMRRMRGREPKLVICGLNPHAGEGGLFGQGEEESFIIPALKKARAAGCDIEGPLPPDTAFLESRRAETDAFICMYHDQGHIPLKALAFDRAVNTTLGLPIVRTSVDHGTALDIAWQGKANPESLFEAVTLAIKLVEV